MGDSSSKDQPSQANSTKQQDDYWDEDQMSITKVELSMFDWKDPVAWITRAKIYFQLHNIFEEVKVRLAHVCMEGATYEKQA